jgi:hypothetical protein
MVIIIIIIIIIIQVYNHLLPHIMPPPKRVQTSLNEGSILLAISTFQSGQFPSISAAATAYNVPKTTLYHRIQGRPSREDHISTNKKLLGAEEDVLIRDILNLGSQGLSPSLSYM